MPQNARECQEFLPQVYEIPKELLREMRSQNQLDAEIAEAEVERYRKAYVDQPIRSVFEIVGDPGASEPENRVLSQYTVILGDPGAGKSTLLQYIALKWAERPVKDLPVYPITLLIELRIYAQNRHSGKCNDILGFLHSGDILERLNQHQLEEWLKRGHAIAMFDGLDEVFDPALREVVVTDIHSFTNKYPKVQAIATSRWLGYKAQRLRYAGFRHFMLQDLTSEQIEYFIQRWHDRTFPEGEDKVRKRERLRKGITNSKAIQELAGNPLLLTMMAILNRSQELPRDRATLYEKASGLLLHQWDVEAKVLEDAELKKFPVVIDLKDKQAMLRQVAYQMQGKEKGLAGNLIRETQLEDILTNYLKTIKEVPQARDIARLTIKQLRIRNFILCYLGGNSYAFVHRTFLEYFCAWEFVWQFKETQTLTLDKLIDDVFGKHWQDESWHEVLLLICGMIEAKFVGEIIEYLLEQKIERREFLDERGELKKEGIINLLLAANCLAEVRNRREIAPIATRLLQVLKKEVEAEYPHRFEPEAADAILMAIATIWQDDPETLPWLKCCLQFDLGSYVPGCAVLAIAQNWKDDPDTLILLKDWAQNDADDFVRRAAVQELARGWKDDSDTLILLKDRVQNDEYYGVRDAAVQELARGWKDDPDTLILLKDWAQNHANEDVRHVAVQELTRGWKDDPDTLILLKDWAQNHANEDVRHVAVQELTRGWKDDPDTLILLKDRAQNDADGYVRRAAVQELTRGWKDDPDTLILLKDRAQNDADGYVRRAAVQELTRGWKDDPDTLILLKDWAQNHGNEDVRHVAVEEIARGWKDDPDTLILLKDWAQNDADDFVRRAAVQELARGWKDDSDTLILLKDRVQNDEYYGVRDAAVEEIARGWKDDPDTLILLKDWAQNDADDFVRRAAVQELARGWKDDPDTLILLKDRAQNDADGYVRGAAVQELARGWKDTPGIFELLCDRAVNDPFTRDDEYQTNPRQTALEAIVRYYHDHPQTLDLLRDRADNDPDEQVRNFAKNLLERRKRAQ